MAYRLEKAARLDKDLARIVAGEFRKALEAIADDTSQAEAIFKARKRLKKIRAILHMLEKDLGRDYAVLDLEFKAIAHRLSGLRDAEAALETVSRVRDHYRHLIAPSIFKSIHNGLAARSRGTMARVHPKRVLKGVVRRLGQLKTTTTRHLRRVAGRGEIRAGITRGYKRARKALAAVHAAPEDVLFHKWRRRVKDHWYHVRLLEGLSPSARARARSLKRLETWLGDDHNLVLLRTTILNDPSRFGDERTTALVLGCVAKYHTTLRKRALKLGDRTFAHRPRLFDESIDRWLRR